MLGSQPDLARPNRSSKSLARCMRVLKVVAGGVRRLGGGRGLRENRVSKKSERKKTQKSRVEHCRQRDAGRDPHVLRLGHWGFDEPMSAEPWI